MNHQGQFPSITLSFALAPGVALGEAVEAVNQAEDDIGCRPMSMALSPAQRKHFRRRSSRAAADSGRSAAVYIVLGMLYESYIHPITILSTLPSAGVGALLALLLFGTDLTVIALIGIILLIGIVKKNAIMMIDFALEAERSDGLRLEERHLSGVPAALPPDHDDHRWPRSWAACRWPWEPAPAPSCAAPSGSRLSAV